ncbi:hypothetical protein QNO07_18930 [Streptomyces sp. 549]|uniref:hypothetical protein n=1 Tax=Streptomyces sp. 549 TaxID=3049076 RepID=UPI0024C23620|nr:hypothetical protein [Streptomyces sp. 549]MDK1475468.1 hypothetical protein [Streptomyces sp. 549]
MPTLRHSVILEPIPRRWLTEALADLHALCEELRSEKGVLHLEDEALPNVEHLEGRHLAPGSRYRITDEFGGGYGYGYGDGEDGAVADVVEMPEPDPVYVEIAHWSRTGPTRLRVAGGDEQTSMDTELTLESVHRPTRVAVSSAIRGVGSFARYRTGELRAKADLDRWYAARNSPAPVTAGFRHPLARGVVRLTMKQQKDGRWRVTFLTSFRGRSWARPLLAVGCVLFRSRLREGYRTGLDSMAESWNADVPTTVAKRPHNLRAELLAALRERD